MEIKKIENYKEHIELMELMFQPIRHAENKHAIMNDNGCITGLYFSNEEYGYVPSHKMNNEECIDTATKLRTLLDKSEELFPKYKLYFEKGSTSKDLKEFLVYYSDIFEKCGGYECLG